MSAVRRAAAGARGDLSGVTGTGLSLVLAAALVTVTGVLVESGLRQPDGAGGLLVTLGSSFAGTALVLVVIVVAATTTLALRRRRREFALLRAIGATRGQVRAQVVTELLLVSAVATPLGAVPGLALARWLDPALREAGVVPADFTATLSPFPVLGAVLVVVPTAVLAGLLAARETLRAAPTAAVRDSAVEPTTVGPLRRGAALATALGGLVVAFTPLVLPGTVGGALAASSAFLLIGAAALAGPLLVEWAFGRAAASSGRWPAASRLAVGNLRGFSRRLTAVVVPLALVLAVGTTQTTVDRALQRATTEQLAASLGADQVATSARGLTHGQLAALADAPGVTGVVPLGDAVAEVRTDDDADLPHALTWEPTRLLVVPPDVDRARLDPGVTRGSLDELARPDTVAISSDSAFETWAGLGDTLTVRLAGHDVPLRVVAVYDHGLGLGHQIVGPATLTAHGVRPANHLALVDSRTAVRVDGVTTTPTAAYVASATSPDVASQHLSTVLTLLLLLFVGLGSLNALVLPTAGRRAELRLLHRTGATARQLLAMTGVESVLTGLAAWALGTVTVLPAVLGVSFGLLGPTAPAVDLPAYLSLSGGVIALAVVATRLTASPTVRAATTR